MGDDPFASVFGCVPLDAGFGEADRTLWTPYFCKIEIRFNIVNEFQ